MIQLPHTKMTSVRPGVTRALTIPLYSHNIVKCNCFYLNSNEVKHLRWIEQCSAMIFCANVKLT
jgi:hypothetical protein